jgi:hypothetical protein
VVVVLVQLVEAMVSVELQIPEVAVVVLGLMMEQVAEAV